MSYSIVQDLESIEKVKSLWNFKPFDEVIIDVTSGNIKVKKEDYQVTGLFPVVDQGKTLIAGYINEDLTVVKGLDYIIFGDHTRIFKYIDFDFVLGADGVKLLRPRLDEVDTKFLYYFFQTLTIPNTGYNRHFKYLKDVIIPVPSIEEQKYIVQVLDKAQSLIDKRKQAIAKLDELVQAVFIDMFGDPVSNERGWEKVKLNQFILNIDSGWSPVCKAVQASRNEWGVLKLSAITSGSYIATENKALLEDTTPKPNLEVRKGDLLFVRKNTLELVGTCAYVFETPSQLMLPDTIFRFVLKEDCKLNKIFLWQLLNYSKVKKQIQRSAGGTAGSMPNISKSKMLNFEVIYPNAELQDKFSEIVLHIEQQKNKHSQSLQQLESNFQALLQKAFKGELKVKDGVAV